MPRGAAIATLVSLLSLADGTRLAPFVGINFAQKLAKNPLDKAVAANLLATSCPDIRAVKIFDHDISVIQALRAAGYTDITLAVPNVELKEMSSSISLAGQITASLAPVVAAGVRLTIAVGNEPLATWYNGAYSPYLVGALTNMRAALAAQHLSSVRLTIPFDFGVVSASYPPSAGAFKNELRDVILACARILQADGSNFMVNIYPFFTHQNLPQVISLAYAVGDSGTTIEGIDYPCLLHVQVGHSRRSLLVHTDLQRFFARKVRRLWSCGTHLAAAPSRVQVAAVRAALLRLDASFGEDSLPIVIGETGWPTAGHPSASAANAATYMRNMVTPSPRSPQERCGASALRAFGTLCRWCSGQRR